MPTKTITPDPLAFNAGELRHSIAMKHRDSSQDSFGQPLNNWQIYRSTMASIRNLSGQELFQTAEFTSAQQVRIRVRWIDDSTRVGDRITWGAHTYIVQLCDNVMGRNRVLQLTCLEINGES